jgi:flagellar motor component MotA|tara:strand:+ start:433 stop:603 length:171 start_codon:yes stop_codon:yes gene_type:complete
MTIKSQNVKISKELKKHLDSSKKEKETYQETIIKLMKENNPKAYRAWIKFKRNYDD